MTFLVAIGMMLFMVGGACMDSKNMIVPAIAVLIGIALTAVGVKNSTADFGE